MLRRRRRLLSLVPLVVLLAVTATAGAGASPPTQVSGTVGNTSATFNSAREAGGNLVIELTATRAYTGTFEGTSTLSGTLIVHADGSANFHDVEVFTGTVNGVQGTVTFRLDGRNDADLAVQSTSTIVGATGGLEGLHGVLHEVGTVVIPNGPVGTYTGRVG
jgi:Protein of unknown function (DUF3224)